MPSYFTTLPVCASEELALPACMPEKLNGRVLTHLYIRICYLHTDLSDKNIWHCSRETAM